MFFLDSGQYGYLTTLNLVHIFGQFDSIGLLHNQAWYILLDNLTVLGSNTAKLGTYFWKFDSNITI